MGDGDKQSREIEVIIMLASILKNVGGCRLRRPALDFIVAANLLGGVKVNKPLTTPTNRVLFLSRYEPILALVIDVDGAHHQQLDMIVIPDITIVPPGHAVTNAGKVSHVRKSYPY